MTKSEGSMSLCEGSVFVIEMSGRRSERYSAVGEVWALRYEDSRTVIGT